MATKAELISLYTINLLDLIAVDCVYWAVRTGSWNMMLQSVKAELVKLHFD